MIRLLCGENNLEYTGDGYLKCIRRVSCPKSANCNILGFDCFAYIDQLPAGCKVNVSDVHIKGSMNRTIEYIVA